MPKVDVASVTSGSKEVRGKRWVRVPEKDLFDFPHPTIRVNLTAYEPGEEYFLDADVADWVENRIAMKRSADIRVMRPNKDIESEQIMNRFGAGSRVGAVSKNPEQELAG
jgi:hypothetical protein